MEYHLIQSKPKDRLVESFKIKFATFGSDWQNRSKPDRIVVSAYGDARIVCDEPRQKVHDQNTYGGDHEITFGRNRSRHIQANAILKMLTGQYDQFVTARRLVLDSAAKWDRFATTVERLHKAFNIPRKQRWHNHRNDYEVDLTIRETKARKANATITVSAYGDIKIKVEEISETKLARVVAAFK